RDADHEGRPPADVPVPLLPPGADDHGRDDREQGARLGVQLRQPERGQRRHEEDAAAHAEEAGEHTGDDAEEPGEDVAHCSSILIAIATSSAAKSSESVRTGTRCCSAVPPAAPSAAGTPTSSA